LSIIRVLPKVDSRHTLFTNAGAITKIVDIALVRGLQRHFERTVGIFCDAISRHVEAA
jgi:hypothetical protein